MFHTKNILNQILKFIDQADTNQLSEIVQSIVKRYGQISPDWETSFLSLPKNDPLHRRQIFQSILRNKKWTPIWESILF